jgi:hypothetical protein
MVSAGASVVKTLGYVTPPHTVFEAGTRFSIQVAV